MTFHGIANLSPSGREPEVFQESWVSFLLAQISYKEVLPTTQPRFIYSSSIEF